MYSSLYGNAASASKKNPETSSQRGGRARSKISTISDPLSLNGLDVAVRPLLDLTAKLLNGKITVKKILTEKSFVVYSEDFKDDLLLKAIPNEENIQRWIDLPPHTNVVTAFDSIPHDGKCYSLTECTNAGNMYQYIESLQLNLGLSVPLSYIELIYDCAIQLATGLEFAHSNGLIHGQFDLSNVVITKDTESLVFKISDFRPTTSMQMPLTSEGALWPFARQKKKITDSEKFELLMLKDIYALGICILEMMIGRVSSTKFSISLDSLPLTWAEFPESTPLIQVLVECINIDSITQRKGKLQNIKKLLIRDYKKFFMRPFYKMELPVVGKRTDVCNKKAIAALSRGEEELALKHWEEAMQMKDEHFDTKLNYLMFKWRSGQISDDELITQLSQAEVFSQSDIGSGLKGMVKLAVGEINEGSEILQNILLQSEQRIPQENELRNLKVERFRQQVAEIVDVLQKEREKFIANRRIQSNHTQRIDCLCINANSRYFATSGKDKVNVWSLSHGTQVKRCCTIQLDASDFQAGSGRVLAAVDSDAQKCVVYKGQGSLFQLYQLDHTNSSLKDTLDLNKEILRIDANAQKMDDFDLIVEMRILEDNKTLRIIQLRKKVPFQIDWNLQNLQPEVKRLDAHRYEDRSIYKYGLTYVQHHDQLNRFVTSQLQKGNMLAFPEKEFQACVVLNKENKLNKYFSVYDIFGERIVRRVKKIEKEGADLPDVFDVDIDGKVLIYAFGSEEIILQSIKIPDPLHKHLRPRYNLALHKENPAKISQQRMTYIDQLNTSFRMFEGLRAAPESVRDKNFENTLLIMMKKIQLGFSNKRLITANREFLKMQKLLIENQLPGKLEIKGLDSLQKIGIFDEIKFSNDLHRIRFLQMSSQLDNNFMLLTIDGTVYKYDLATKDLLFSFKSQAMKSLSLYNRDRNLLVGDTQQLKLWEFQQNDEAPEMITVQSPQIKVEQVFVNREGDSRYAVVCFKNNFEVYDEKLDIIFRGSLPGSQSSISEGQGNSQAVGADGEVIRTAEFNQQATAFYIGTDQARVYKYTIATQQVDPSPLPLLPSSQHWVDLLYCLHNHGAKGSKDVFIAYLTQKGLVTFDYEKKKTLPHDDLDPAYQGEIAQVKSTSDGQFVLVGIPATQSLLVYKLNKTTLALTMLKRVQVDGFRTFECDASCTQIVFMNQKCRVIDLYAVKWEFEVKMPKNKVDNINEEEMIEALKSYMPDKPNKVGGRKIGEDPLAAAVGSSNNKTQCCSIF